MDDAGCAQFIGISSYPVCSVTYFGKNAFDTPAQELFDLIAARDDSGEHRFNDSKYVFPNQIVTLWDADEQYDRLGNRSRLIWAQIGVGNRTYLAAIGEIENRGA